MRKLSENSLKRIEEFRLSGFARSSASLVYHFIRKNKDPYIRIFRPGSRYSSNDIFGHSRFSHIYDARCAEKFVNYLVDVFLLKNPEPDANTRKAFTRILHNNGLHWEQCWHLKNKENGANLDEE